MPAEEKYAMEANMSTPSTPALFDAFPSASRSFSDASSSSSPQNINMDEINFSSPAAFPRRSRSNASRIEKVKQKPPRSICSRAFSRITFLVCNFLCDPARTAPVAFVLFAVSYCLLFDLRTHLILLCAMLGTVLLAISIVLRIQYSGGLLSFLSPTTQHMLLDYNLLELIKISWHSRTLQDILSLVIFPLTRTERRRLIERLPAKLSAVLTRRGIVHLLPRPARHMMGDGQIHPRVDRATRELQMEEKRKRIAFAHQDKQGADSDVERLRISMLSSSSQPNLAALNTDDFTSEVPTTRHVNFRTSPSPCSSPSSSFSMRGRSRSLSALVQAENEADREAHSDEESDSLQPSDAGSDAELASLHVERRKQRQRDRRRSRRREVASSGGSKDFALDEDFQSSWVNDLNHASVASTSSSSSSNSNMSSLSNSSSTSSSGTSSPDLRDRDVRNYDECTPSPASMMFSSSSQRAAAFNQHANQLIRRTFNTTHSASSRSFGSSSSSTVHPHHSHHHYRAPVSTFLPLPPSIDDLNFSNLLDRQIREHAKEGMKSMGKAMLEGAHETIETYLHEIRAVLPEQLLPYFTSYHAKILLPLASTLITAQLTFRSPRFRALFVRVLRFGFDCSVLGAALFAMLTAYRELTVSMQSNSNHHRLRRVARSVSDGANAFEPTPLSPVALLPSFTFFNRVHALSSTEQHSALYATVHRFRLMLTWLHMRYRASGPLRMSTAVLMLWMLWLGRNTNFVRGHKEQLLGRVKHLLNKK